MSKETTIEIKGNKYKIEDIQDECTAIDTEELYRDCLDEAYGDCKIAGLSYTTSKALEEIDPAAFRCGHRDWLDSESENLVEIESDYYRIEDIESYCPILEDTGL